MASFEQGDVVRVPFPYTNRPTRQARPALVVSRGNAEEGFGLLWVVMITSAENRGWPDDVLIADLTGTGLPAASVVRPAKIATIEVADVSRLGRVPESIRLAVMQAIAKRLA
ncbi:type II toxin-antitoxin system PemK/MazF family toxin [Pseudomonas lopnurensis]|uniref:type II toxin-antitoxin system PemK/MazF family toxin n=1 Tax=Pseudomonas lopnurensis TaxID=1477517 RepID=UPI00187A95EE|nr:type II toxin-antitoxin system PemK/MazF family toxin [Pseudomonas lopnurensis]MBE7374152.1 type II toxin-antitoxin system PemK/MazF family toxin [Pseudomonas lopnurensis]